jgi:hypothetical protein
MSLILFYIAFMIGGALAAYFLGLLVDDCIPGRLLLCSLGLLGARSLGNQTETFRTKCEMRSGTEKRGSTSGPS